MNTLEDKYDMFKIALEEAIESQVEYYEEHDDALDAYSHLPAEGGWQYNNCDKKLVEFAEKHDIDLTGIDLDEIAKMCLESVEMISGHIFSNPSELVIDSYPIQEHEIAIEINTLESITGFDKETCAVLWNRAVDDNDFCLREKFDVLNPNQQVYAYEVTDCVIFATISCELLEGIVDDLKTN